MTASTFASLGLPQEQLDNLQQMGYEQMTEIQQQALPAALEGKDVLAQARTGSGKTAAFGIALLSRINPRFFGAQTLIMCPTRELADQVTVEIRRLARAEESLAQARANLEGEETIQRLEREVEARKRIRDAQTKLDTNAEAARALRRSNIVEMIVRFVKR